MKNNEIQSFIIDYDKHEKCQLVNENEEKVEEYYVKKTKWQNKWHFMASTSKEFKEVEQVHWFLGESICKNGFINNVEVAIKGRAPLSGAGPSLLNARRCGIGTILSALCMIDKDVNRGTGIVLDLNEHFKESELSEHADVDTIKKIKEDCEKVIGLQMMAAPGAGNIYFQAAALAGFNRMIFYDRYEKEEWIWPHVSDAQRCYNTNELGCKNDYYNGIYHYWYFCKEKDTTNNPVSSCFKCLISCRLKFGC